MMVILNLPVDDIKKIIKWGESYNKDDKLLDILREICNQNDGV